MAHLTWEFDHALKLRRAGKFVAILHYQGLGVNWDLVRELPFRERPSWLLKLVRTPPMMYRFHVTVGVSEAQVDADIVRMLRRNHYLLQGQARESGFCDFDVRDLEPNPVHGQLSYEPDETRSFDIPAGARNVHLVFDHDVDPSKVRVRFD